jgi:hypothetical protein
MTLKGKVTSVTKHHTIKARMRTWRKDSTHSRHRKWMINFTSDVRALCILWTGCWVGPTAQSQDPYRHLSPRSPVRILYDDHTQHSLHSIEHPNAWVGKWISICRTHQPFYNTFRRKHYKKNYSVNNITHDSDGRLKLTRHPALL